MYVSRPDFCPKQSMTASVLDHAVYVSIYVPGTIYITLHYITSFHTPITPTVTNGASTKSFKFSECELKEVSFQTLFESISVCEFLEIGRKRIPCLRSGERETPLAEL